MNKKVERKKGKTHPLRERERERMRVRIFKSTCICIKAQLFESGAIFREFQHLLVIDGELREGEKERERGGVFLKRGKYKKKT